MASSCSYERKDRVERRIVTNFVFEAWLPSYPGTNSIGFGFWKRDIGPMSCWRFGVLLKSVYGSSLATSIFRNLSLFPCFSNNGLRSLRYLNWMASADNSGKLQSATEKRMPSIMDPGPGKCKSKERSLGRWTAFILGAY
jgi:hypothetical protein